MLHVYVGSKLRAIQASGFKHICIIAEMLDCQPPFYVTKLFMDICYRMLFFCCWQYCCTDLLEFKYFQVIKIFQFGNSKLPEREDFFVCIIEVDCLYENEYLKML